MVGQEGFKSTSFSCDIVNQFVSAVCLRFSAVCLQKSADFQLFVYKSQLFKWAPSSGEIMY